MSSRKPRHSPGAIKPGKLKASLAGCGLAFVVLAGPAAAQGNPESEARMREVVKVLIGPNAVQVGRTNATAGGHTAQFVLKRVVYIVSVQGGRIHVAGTHDSNGPPRTGPSPYASEKAAIDHTKGRLKALLGRREVGKPVVRIRSEQAQGPRYSRYGSVSVVTHMTKHGYPFVDRFVGARITIDTKTGALREYEERFAFPDVKKNPVKLSQSEALARAARIAKMPESRFEYRGLGWRKQGDGPGVLAYAFAHPTTNVSDFTTGNIVFIHTTTGAQLGNKEDPRPWQR